MAIKHIVANELIKNNLVNEFDFIDLSYANSRLKELKLNKLNKQKPNGLAPCIKTNMQNYGVVVND